MILLSNLLSWFLVSVLWALIPHYRLSTDLHDRILGWLYFFLGFSLIVTALLRYVEDTHNWILLGGTLSKLFLINIVLVIAHKTYKQRGTLNG